MTSKLNDIRGRLARYDDAANDLETIDERYPMPSMVRTDADFAIVDARKAMQARWRYAKADYEASAPADLRALLAAVEAAVGLIENTAPAGNIDDGETWLYRWDAEEDEFRCLGCGSPLGKPHAENEVIPCYGRLLDEAVAKLAEGSE